jgi:serine protease inhibitor
VLGLCRVSGLTSLVTASHMKHKNLHDISPFYIDTLAKVMKITNKEAVKVVAKGNEAFNNKLFKVLANGQDSNLIMSSFSVSSVLSMILYGAGGQTAEQLRSGLGFQDDKCFEMMGPGYKDILGLLQSNENITLNAANR